jgi:hypothetical protein
MYTASSVELRLFQCTVCTQYSESKTEADYCCYTAKLAFEQWKDYPELISTLHNIINHRITENTCRRCTSTPKDPFIDDILDQLFTLNLRPVQRLAGWSVELHYAEVHGEKGACVVYWCNTELEAAEYINRLGQQLDAVENK